MCINRGGNLDTVSQTLNSISKMILNASHVQIMNLCGLIQNRLWMNHNRLVNRFSHKYTGWCTYMDRNSIDRSKFDKNIFAFIWARQKWDYWEMKAAALTVHLINHRQTVCSSVWFTYIFCQYNWALMTRAWSNSSKNELKSNGLKNRLKTLEYIIFLYVPCQTVDGPHPVPSAYSLYSL